MRENALYGGWRVLSWVLAAVAIWLVIGTASQVEASSLRRTAEVVAVEQARPSVVNIHGRKTVSTESTDAGGNGMQQVNGMGTGIVIDERGYVVTNYHVVEGNASEWKPPHQQTLH